jgi:nucleoside-diphosphate-sugar epimerase
MHVLVTGGAGYIGSTLVPLLLEARHRVTVVDRFFFGEEPLRKPSETAGESLRIVRADVRRADPRVFEGIDALVDLGGISNDPSCELDVDLTRSINVEGSVRVARLAQAAGASRIVFASSCSVYGHGQGTHLTEDSPLRPVSLYAECKAEVERRLTDIAKITGITLTCLRFATVFGVSPRMRFDLAINVMTKNAYVGRRITVEGGGRQWRPFVHVRDVAEAIRRTLESPTETVAGQVLNVGSTDNNLRILNLAYRVRDQIPGTEVIMAPTDPDRRDYNVAFEKIRSVLDFTPGISVDEGIREVLEALRTGAVDPEDRLCYTLKQYLFLAEAERTFNAVALDGRILG